MPEVNVALIHKVAELSRLEIPESEIQEYVQSISTILKHVEQLNSVDTTGVEPMNYGVDGSLRLRDDIVKPMEKGKEGKPKILESAPEVVQDGFKVPQMVG